MRVMIIAPHLDDEVLGCGGIIRKHVRHRDQVAVVFVANRVYNHVFDQTRMQVELAHCAKAKKILGYDRHLYLDLPDERLYLHIQEIIVGIEKLIARLRPAVVYSPFHQDNHQDHRAVAEAVRVVLRPAATPFLKRWLMYETPSSTEQSPPLPGCTFQPNCHVDIHDVLDCKLRAWACYETEARKFPHPRSPEAIRHLAASRGIEAGMTAAEAFMVLRDNHS